MEMQELEITIDKNGKVEIKVNGVKGPQCLTITKQLQQALGETLDQQHTSEYYEKPQGLQARDDLKGYGR